MSTYRLFVFSIFPVLYILSIIIYRFYTEQFKNHITKLQRFIVIIILFISFLYGITTNYKYAKIGYNDGVQFDLDGFKGRLFTGIENDNSQKLFYNTVKNKINSDDIIFTPSPFLTNFYLSNQVYDLNQIFNSEIKGDKYYVIISREYYPNEISKGYSELRNLVVSIRDTLIIGNFHLLEIDKEQFQIENPK